MNSVPSLIERLGIKAVYWIDDENATVGELDVEKLAGQVAALLARSDKDERTKGLDPLKKIGKARDLARKIGDRLEKQDEGDAEGDVLSLLQENLDQCVDDPVTILSRMLKYLPKPLGPQEKEGLVKVFKGGEWAMEALSFSRWQQEHATILDHHADGAGGALLIVDIQNDSESSPISGEDVLHQWAHKIVSADKPLPVYAVALTSKYVEAEELLAARRFTNRLFGEGGKANLPVLVVSKHRIDSSAAEDVEAQIASAFEKALGRLRTFVLHVDLAKETKVVFSASVDSAFQTLQQLSIEEMLFSVSATAFNEGASEVDTLVRMASIAQRQALLGGLMGNAVISSALVELRGLHDLVGFISDPKDLDTRDGIEQLRCSELHDPADVVNGLLSPLSTGDLFEIVRDSGAVEYHVLASNACDLMLRGKTGSRKLDAGLLLELRAGDVSQKGDEYSPAYRLAHFPEGSPLFGQNRYVDLRRMWTVPLAMLDLCWTDVQGRCVWAQEGHLPDKFKVLPGQQRRYEQISSVMTGLSDAQKLTGFAPGISRDDAVFGQNGDGLVSVTFNVRRIGRLASSVALELTSKLAHSIGRPSMEHDFTRR